MNPIPFITQLVAEQRYGTLAVLVIISPAIGYLFAQVLKVTNACYHRRAAKKQRLLRNG